MTVKPILVTGSPRSGTTWVGRMLAVSPQLYYVHEPFNPDYGPGRGICNINFTHHQTYITKENQKKYYKPIRQMLEGRYNIYAGIRDSKLEKKNLIHVWHKKKEFAEYRKKNMVPLIKDPIAAMSAGWLGRQFNINTIVMIRHPAAFVASMKRLNWTFRPSKWVLNQPLLIRDYLSPFREEIKNLTDSKYDIIDRTALMWKIIYFVVLKYQQTFKDWVYLRHEDISLDPLAHFEKLYKRFNLDFTDETQEQILIHSNVSNPTHANGVDQLLKLNSKNVIYNWKSVLSGGEIKRIKDRVDEVSRHFYSARDW
jgi:hypothetical protein